MSDLVTEPTDDEFSRLLDERAPNRLSATDSEPADNATAIEEPAAPEPAAAEENVPDPKYAGKSPDELIEMHRQLETRLGQQGQELGELRGLRSEMEQLRGAIAQQAQPQQQPITQDTVDWVDESVMQNPQGTLDWVQKNQPQLYQRALGSWASLDPVGAMSYENRRMLAERDSVWEQRLAKIAAPVQQSTDERQLAEAMAMVGQRLPNLSEVVNDLPTLLQESPELVVAMKNGDAEAKARILENLAYTALGRRGATAQAQVAEQQQAATAAKTKATTVRGSAASERGGETPTEGTALKERMLATEALSIHAELERNRAKAR